MESMHCVTFLKLFEDINELINQGGDFQKTWDLQYTKLNDTDPDDGVGLTINVEMFARYELCEISICPYGDTFCELAKYEVRKREDGNLFVDIALIDPRGCNDDSYVSLANGQVLVLFGILLALNLSIYEVILTDIAKEEWSKRDDIRQMAYEKECQRNNNQVLKRIPMHCLSYYRQFGFNDMSVSYVEIGNCKDNDGRYHEIGNKRKFMSLELTSCPLFMTEMNDMCVIRFLNINKKNREDKEKLERYMTMIRLCHANTTNEC